MRSRCWGWPGSRESAPTPLPRTDAAFYSRRGGGEARPHPPQNVRAPKPSVPYPLSFCSQGICKSINPFLTTMSNNMAKIAEARKTVEQLKLEVNIERMKVSKAAAELLAFCEAHVKEDPLVTPVPAAENPFREKRLFCVLL
ncbi:guanine nucleotide-binding protein G(I)/G(S)/G(O) subunit gamma-8 isoform X1 [Phascolarctos cinereus]|uniref:Guanine nucleotide-binding protein subunit gamma n=3 Tax=Diprotodontia TaxID=38609 RepID=A0A6P5JS61_PHACI|nr:guanine nucleotide-binding protein G(I)/G(S)/G(O) subunit gamma-8 isoform X1 [Phascolarctos cinereus]